MPLLLCLKMHVECAENAAWLNCAECWKLPRSEPQLLVRHHMGSQKYPGESLCTFP